MEALERRLPAMLYTAAARGPATPGKRNAACPCGSGKKSKRCHPRYLPIIPAPLAASGLPPAANSSPEGGHAPVAIPVPG